MKTSFEGGTENCFRSWTVPRTMFLLGGKILLNLPGRTDSFMSHLRGEMCEGGVFTAQEREDKRMEHRKGG